MISRESSLIKLVFLLSGAVISLDKSIQEKLKHFDKYSWLWEETP